MKINGCSIKNNYVFDAAPKGADYFLWKGFCIILN
jgi:hypothetical protein